MPTRSNMKTPTRDQVNKNVRFDRAMWESLSVMAREVALREMYSVTAADLVRKFCAEGLERQNGKGGRK